MRTGHRKPVGRAGFFAVGAALLGAALLQGMVRPARVQPLCFPLQTAQYRISDAYGWRSDPFTGQETFHAGIDLACAEGTAVCAAETGMVLQAARSESYGNYLELLHPDGSRTRYAHLQDLHVRPGEVVQAGQRLGTAGQTGRATGVHLHFELWRQGMACDPAAALGLADEA